MLSWRYGLVLYQVVRLLTSKSQDTQPISRDLYNDHKAHKHFLTAVLEPKCKSPKGKMICTSHGP